MANHISHLLAYRALSFWKKRSDLSNKRKINTVHTKALQCTGNNKILKKTLRNFQKRQHNPNFLEQAPTLLGPSLIEHHLHLQNPQYVHCTPFLPQYKTIHELFHARAESSHLNRQFLFHTLPFCSMYILDSEAAIDFASSSSRFLCI